MDEDAPRHTSSEEAFAAASAHAVDPLARAVARAQAARALFGRAAAVHVGRYRLLEPLGAGGMAVVWSAFDPELGRAVALKLASAGNEAARAKARAEGRVLAKLSHPNVVPIYDVVDSEPGVFLVMELVRGQTLRAYAEDLRRSARPRQSWRPGTSALAVLVRAYRDAAHGLAAAHAAGLIHRDFKPDNAAVGADGRVRVLDFGLALDPESLDGKVAGTLQYMAPEQRGGRAVPASDQYALCVSLREALGRPPPRWLAAILERGAAEDPNARYPSMSALASALGRDPGAIWRRRGTAALAASAVALGVAVGRQQRAEPSCDGGVAQLQMTWGNQRQTGAAHLAKLSGAYAMASSAQILTTLDGYASQWMNQHRADCKAHARGELSTVQHDRRTLCLTRSRAALTTAARLLSEIATPQLPGLIEATAALPELALCEDDAALTTGVPPPSPAIAERVTGVERRLAELAVLRDVGRLDDASALADAAMSAAHDLGYGPLTASVYLARGRIDATRRANNGGVIDLAIATRMALSSGDYATAVEAFARRAGAVARGASPDRHVDGLSLIEPLAESLGERGSFARAYLQGTLGTIALIEGKHQLARERYDRAVALANRVTGPRAAELTAIRFGQIRMLTDPAEIAERAAEFLAVRDAQVGGAHPIALRDRVALAVLAPDDGAVSRALTPPCRALAAYPELASAITECSSEAALLAALSGDDPALATWSAIVDTSVDHGGAPALVKRAAAFHALAEGDARGALDAFRAARGDLELEPDAGFWLHAIAAELALGGAAAARRLGDDGARRDELRVAAAALDACAADLAPPVLRRRRAELDALSR
ncbi:MAG: serine/threonine-protein kinase [Kofleriaceae bacterium]